MEHVRAFLIKFGIITVVLLLVFGLFYGVDFADIVSISLILSIVAYIGDLAIMPRVGNTIATLGDIALSYVMLYVLGGLFIEAAIPLGWASFISAVIIGGGEFFFHRYLQKTVTHDPDKERDTHSEFRDNAPMATEFADEEELNPNVRKED
ncbi:YndM family protein [Pseudalkalibacillus caeni]|nr:YndM family protein [Pseudalkalibacillus caeni]